MKFLYSFLLCLSLLSYELFAKKEFSCTLLTTYYNEKNPKRVIEYKKCFTRNAANPLIKKIVILSEDPASCNVGFLKHPKITVCPLEKRPTYADFLNYANTYLHNSLVIVANADIFFDHTLNYLRSYSFDNKLLALTRYNVPEYKGRWKRHPRSHDAWIFEAPLHDIDADIVLGVPGCDIKFAYNLIKAGIHVINPSLSVQAWHQHLSDKRSYKDWLITHEYREYIRGLPSLYTFMTPFSAISTERLAKRKRLCLYAGDLPMHQPDYKNKMYIGLSATKEDTYHIKQDINQLLPFLDNCVDVFQAEDVFASIQPYKLVDIIDEIFRVLKPRGLLRISLPDYRSEILYNRAEKDVQGNIITDPRSKNNWYPTIEMVMRLLEKTKFAQSGKIDYVQYYKQNGIQVAKKYDSKKRFFLEKSAHGKHLQDPDGRMSIIVDLYKGIR